MKLKIFQFRTYQCFQHLNDILVWMGCSLLKSCCQLPGQELDELCLNRSDGHVVGGMNNDAVNV